MPNLGSRTDLALESANTVKSEGQLPRGISADEKKTACFTVTSVEVITEEAAEKIGKPVGRYITLETAARLDMKPEKFEQSVCDLAEEITSLVGDAKSVLVVGLGNEEITPDSLGPRVVSHIFATRHIKENAPELMSEDLGEVCALAPGVMGQTGLEASELVKTVCSAIKPSAVIAVDALACSELSHLGRTVQLTDTGISPGSGVMNARKELSLATLGVPTVAIGVPTIADLGSEKETMMVTPRSIDKLIGCTAQLISSALNLALHRGLSLDEILNLTA